MAEYISRNKFKATKTNEDLYSSILKSLKDSKGVQLQGMTGFQYTPVEKKAALGDSIKDGWKAFKDYSRENQWVQPTLQGAAGAGIGALTGLLMGPKQRAMKLLISTLGGAGIGVGTGFATNYALKKEKQQADEDAAVANAEIGHIDPNKIKQWQERVRPSDRALLPLQIAIADSKRRAAYKKAVKSRDPKDMRIVNRLHDQLTALEFRAKNKDIDYNLTNPETPEDTVWRLQGGSKHFSDINQRLLDEGLRVLDQHSKKSTDYLLNDDWLYKHYITRTR